MKAKTLFLLLALSVAPAWALWRLSPTIDLRWSVGAVVVLSTISATLYAIDKRRARAAAWRIPESTLHLSALAGGWPGALLAQRLARHKTRKTGFQVVFWSIVALHQVVAADCAAGWRISRWFATIVRD